MELLKTHLGRFRVIAFLEGLSFILLMGIAMPLKYMYDMPQMVQQVGMAHGLLFVVYMFMLIPLKQELNLSYKTVGMLILASLIPFGTFIADYKILRNKVKVQEQEA